MKPLVALLVLSLALAGCNRGGLTPVATDSSRAAVASPSESLSASPGKPTRPSSPSSSAPPSPSPTLAQGCPNQAAILSDPGLLRPGSLRADLDGDGRKDTVRVALDRQGGAGCQAFLVVRLGKALVIAPIERWEPNLVLSAPHLNTAARIDSAKGDDVVVDVTAGASTQFEAVYGYRAGRLAPVGLKGFPFNGLYPYGGSVGHIDGEACTDRQLVVISSAVPVGVSGRRYRVVRRFFRPAPGVLVYQPKRTQRKVLPAGAVSRLREFSAGPFGGCRPL